MEFFAKTFDELTTKELYENFEIKVANFYYRTKYSLSGYG